MESEELRRLITQDVVEREAIRESIKRVRTRQNSLTIIGLLILGMFIVNFFQFRTQIKQQNDILHASKLIIESKDEEIESKDTVINIQDMIIDSLLSNDGHPKH